MENENHTAITIPSDEFPVRWRNIKRMMEEKDLDIVLAFSTDHAVFGNAHARWIFNFPTHFEPVCILITRNSDPVLLCGPESDQYALQVSQAKNVRVVLEFCHPEEDYPFSRIESFKSVLNDIAGDLHKISKVGTAGGNLVSFDIFKSFREIIPGAEWVNVETEMCTLRAVKSRAEIDVIRHAYKIAEHGFEAAINAIRPGMTERNVAAAIECAMRHSGSEGTGIDTIVASGPNSRTILARSTFRKIQKNEIILLTIVPRYEGYHAAIGRAVTIGKPSSEVSKALKVAAMAQDECYKGIKINRKGSEVEAIGRNIVEREGFGKYFMYSGVHSVGVCEFEPPIFGPSCNTVLDENMIISIDIPMFNASWGGLRIEDGYLLHADSTEKLNHTPYLVEL